MSAPTWRRRRAVLDPTQVNRGVRLWIGKEGCGFGFLFLFLVGMNLFVA